MDQARLLVSLDFELYWGVRDLYPLEDRKANLLQVRSAVSRILDLFERYEIHATWATVGLMFAKNRQEMSAAAPAIRPSYSRPQLSAYPEFESVGEDEQEDPFHYAASMIRRIRQTPHQEIGTHTFSHYYCLEDGQTETQFRADLDAAIRLAAKWNLNLRSLVFPRNQVNESYLGALRDLGVESYRGAGSHWLYRQRKRSDESPIRRAVRLLDAYLNLSGHHTFSCEEMPQAQPFNFPSSRLLRQFLPALAPFEGLRMSRICSGLDHAARTREIYHLWFHPEELASHQDQNMAALETVLQRFSQLRDRGLMESLTMHELSHRVPASEPAPVRELVPHRAAQPVSRAAQPVSKMAASQRTGELASQRLG